MKITVDLNDLLPGQTRFHAEAEDGCIMTWADTDGAPPRSLMMILEKWWKESASDYIEQAKADQKEDAAEVLRETAEELEYDRRGRIKA